MFLTTHLEQLRRTLQAIRAFMPHSGVASNSADAPSGHSAAVPVEAATTPPRPHTTPSPTGATLTPQALPRASTTSAPPPLSGEPQTGQALSWGQTFGRAAR